MALHKKGDMRPLSEASEWLFSYGTLQDPAVQRANFGRELVGQHDLLPGYELAWIAIQDPDVVTLSGKANHLIIQPCASLAEEVAGMVFQITPQELAAADEYEVSEYKRVAVTLKSGLTAWAYVWA
jgi:gamma-glutamylcyclotransferase (GGCT)/AIG2-like uncharacterized protein YtfP